MWILVIIAPDTLSERARLWEKYLITVSKGVRKTPITAQVQSYLLCYTLKIACPTTTDHCGQRNHAGPCHLKNVSLIKSSLKAEAADKTSGQTVVHKKVTGIRVDYAIKRLNLNPNLNLIVWCINWENCVNFRFVWIFEDLSVSWPPQIKWNSIKIPFKLVVLDLQDNKIWIPVLIVLSS